MVETDSERPWWAEGAATPAKTERRGMSELWGEVRPRCPDEPVAAHDQGSQDSARDVAGGMEAGPAGPVTSAPVPESAGEEEVGVAEAVEHKADEPGHDTASRLSSLRSLMFTLEPRSSAKAQPELAEGSQAAPPRTTGPLQMAASEPGPAPTLLRDSPVVETSRPVAVQPQPPESQPAGPQQPKERPQDLDDIEILPARRGQYDRGR